MTKQPPIKTFKIRINIVIKFEGPLYILSRTMNDSNRQAMKLTANLNPERALALFDGSTQGWSVNTEVIAIEVASDDFQAEENDTSHCLRHRQSLSLPQHDGEDCLYEPCHDSCPLI